MGQLDASINDLSRSIIYQNALLEAQNERMANFPGGYTPPAYWVSIEVKVGRQDDLFQPNEATATFRNQGDDLGVAASAAATSLNAWLQREVETIYSINEDTLTDK